MIRVFVGYDSKLPVLYNVLQHSIQARASRPVAVIPIMLSQLKSVYTREAHPLASTEFSFSRFLTPYLSGYEGWSIFMDNDMLVLDDIAKLWDMRDDRHAVMAIKHDHKPREGVKFLDRPQTKYEKKNWSSVMMFNNAKCRALTPEYVNAANGLELHQFKWLDSDDQIGALPPRWNHLVGYDLPNPHASLVHYTSGGPYFDEFHDVEHAEAWRRERERMLSCAQRQSSQAAA
jgi:lipopolysaccharide biosynthesis glycosyltransferase